MDVSAAEDYWVMALNFKSQIIIFLGNNRALVNNNNLFFKERVKHKITQGFISLEIEGVPQAIRFSFYDKKGFDTTRAILSF